MQQIVNKIVSIKCVLCLVCTLVLSYGRLHAYLDATVHSMHTNDGPNTIDSLKLEFKVRAHVHRYQCHFHPFLTIVLLFRCVFGAFSLENVYSSMVKKWQTLIEANIDVKTTDGYLLRVFCIGFTAKDAMSQRKTCYAQHSQVRAIRKKMCDIITRDVTSSDLKEVVNKLLPDSIAKDIEKACQGIYPLHDVYIRKVSTFVDFNESNKMLSGECRGIFHIVHTYHVRRLHRLETKCRRSVSYRIFR